MPIDVTLFGMVTLVRLLELNAKLSIVVTPLGIVTLVRSLYSNAEIPIVVILLGITISLEIPP